MGQLVIFGTGIREDINEGSRQGDLQGDLNGTNAHLGTVPTSLRDKRKNDTTQHRLWVFSHVHMMKQVWYSGFRGGVDGHLTLVVTLS